MSTTEIQAERDAQLVNWGRADDDGWTMAEWSALMCHYASRNAVGDLKAMSPAVFRRDVVKIGALAIACLEAIDRKTP